MTSIRVVFVAMLMALSSLAVGQEPTKKLTSTKNDDRAALEKTLWDVEQHWLCISGPYALPYKDCVQFRSKFWAEQFFEISAMGKVENKSEMVARQTAANPAPGVGPYPRDFKLQAVYGNIAMATDTTAFKTVDAGGHLAVTSQTRVLRVFVKENGAWRPAAAALVPLSQ